MNLPADAIRKLSMLGLGDKLGEVLTIIADAEEPKTKRKAAPASKELALFPSSFDSSWPDEYQELFWAIAPRKRGKDYAMKVLDKIRDTGKYTWPEVFGGWQRHAVWAKSQDIRFVPHPASWLNAGGWKDELKREELTNGSHNSAAATALRLAGQGFRLNPRPGAISAGKGESDIRQLPKR